MRQASARHTYVADHATPVWTNLRFHTEHTLEALLSTQEYAIFQFNEKRIVYYADRCVGERIFMVRCSAGVREGSQQIVICIRHAFLVELQGHLNLSESDTDIWQEERNAIGYVAWAFRPVGPRFGIRWAQVEWMKFLAVVAFQPLVLWEVSLDQNQESYFGLRLGTELWGAQCFQERLASESKACSC